MLESEAGKEGPDWGHIHYLATFCAFFLLHHHTYLSSDSPSPHILPLSSSFFLSFFLLWILEEGLGEEEEEWWRGMEWRRRLVEERWPGAWPCTCFWPHPILADRQTGMSLLLSLTLRLFLCLLSSPLTSHIPPVSLSFSLSLSTYFFFFLHFYATLHTAIHETSLTFFEI